MLGLQLNHVSKRGQWKQNVSCQTKWHRKVCSFDLYWSSKVQMGCTSFCQGTIFICTIFVCDSMAYYWENQILQTTINSFRGLCLQPSHFYSNYEIIFICYYHCNYCSNRFKHTPCVWWADDRWDWFHINNHRVGYQINVQKYISGHVCALC